LLTLRKGSQGGGGDRNKLVGDTERAFAREISIGSFEGTKTKVHQTDKYRRSVLPTELFNNMWGRKPSVCRRSKNLPERGLGGKKKKKTKKKKKKNTRLVLHGFARTKEGKKSLNPTPISVLRGMHLVLKNRTESSGGKKVTSSIQEGQNYTTERFTV